MKQQIIFLIFLTSSLSFSACSQQSKYAGLFDWMVQTFEENEAGFSYYLEKIGEDNYKKHVSEYREKIGQATSEQEFLKLMNEWLHYFRKGHIAFYTKRTSEMSETQKDSIRTLYQNEEVVVNECDFKKYLTEKSVHPLEGIWKSRHERVGIRQLRGKINQFEGFIFKADSVYWFPGQKILECTLKNDTTIDLSYYDKNRTTENLTASFSNETNGIIYIKERPWLLRTYPETDLSQRDSLYQALLISTKPFIKKLSSQTIYLRLPSFEINEKKSIDALITENVRLIRSTPNLIIDIRYGTGGSDLTHFGLMPYYYTQPIRHPGVEYRATELNVRMYKKLQGMIPDSTSIKRWIALEEKMMKNLGKYIDVNDGPFIYDRFTPLKYPERIAIICNKNNGSADESFLYNARQSYKTKIFGEPTGGMMDFSNLNMIDSPEGKYILCLARSADKRVPDYMIDDIGIQPDFYIDDAFKEKDWVMFVKSIVETR